MDKKWKNWELALIAGLLTSLLGGTVNAAAIPLSRWQTGEEQARYQLSLFPFGFAPAEETAMARPAQPAQPEYELSFQLLEWWQGLFGDKPACSHSSDRE